MLVYGENESPDTPYGDNKLSAGHEQRFILSHQLTSAALVALEKTLHYLLMLVVMYVFTCSGLQKLSLTLSLQDI